MSDADRTRWDARWRGRDRGAPSPVVRALAPWLPTTGRAVDLAGGLGRHAAWLSEQGLNAVLADISTEALRRAPSGVTPLPWDADVGPPPGPWDLVLVHHFLDRVVLGRVQEVLAPAGRLVVVHPTVRNLEKHARPSRRWLLDNGELPTLVPGLTVLHHNEGWRETGWYEASLVAAAP